MRCLFKRFRSLSHIELLSELPFPNERIAQGMSEFASKQWGGIYDRFDHPDFLTK
jgi:hypothetical protein